MAEFKLTKVNFKGTSDYLRDELFKRNLFIPTDEEGKLIREHAISLLQDWEATHKYDEKPRKCRVIFHHSMNPSSGPYVFASLNEKTYQAPYEKQTHARNNRMCMRINGRTICRKEQQQCSNRIDSQQNTT